MQQVGEQIFSEEILSPKVATKSPFQKSLFTLSKDTMFGAWQQFETESQKGERASRIFLESG